MLTVSSGLTGQPRRWFAFWIAIAAVIWASYAALLGYAFGAAFEDNHTVAFLVAFGAALSITALIELIRWARDGTTTATAAIEADDIGDTTAEHPSGRRRS